MITLINKILKMPIKKISIISALTLSAFILILIPFISAYSWGRWYGYQSPLDYLENEWILFTVLFLIFFATIFYTLNKAFKNKGVAAVIAGGISLLISLAISQKGLIERYGLGLEFSSWILLIALLIAIGFLIRFAAESFGNSGVVASVIIIWILIRAIEPSQILPDTLMSSSEFMTFYENFLMSFLGLIIIGVIAFILSRGVRKTVGEVEQAMKKARTRIRW